MCGIASVIKEKRLNKVEKEIFIKIMKESSIRGVHSFGFSYIQNEKLLEYKNHYLEKTIDFFSKNIQERFIFHNRYSTSGDWRAHANNQPITDKNNALVFNGVISMKQKQEMEEEFNVKIDNDNDGEVFLKNIKNPLKFLKNNKVSFAGLFFENNKIHALRNHLRPTWYSVKSETVFIASTKDILKRAGLDNVFSTKPNKIYKMRCFFGQKKGLHRLSYKNDEQWGYRPSKQLPALHCE